MLLDFKRLEKNLCDAVKECQIKLGFEKETMRFYYPMPSLLLLLGTKQEEKIKIPEELETMLKPFKEYTAPRLGNIKITHVKERFCFSIPVEGVIYIYEKYKASEVFTGFVQLVQKHGCTIEDIKTLFEQFSREVICEKILEEDADYVIYFKDAGIDEYLYVLKFDDVHEGHVTYHRYTREDYEELR